jgi:hypothetical protein
MTKTRVWSIQDVQSWFVGRVPDGWFGEAPRVVADRDEILVVGMLRVPELAGAAEAAAPDAGQPGDEQPGDEQLEVTCRARIAGFREETRDQRMRIADEAELLWGRKVSWGATCGEVEQHFTTQSSPVMTRLRMPERAVLDTLIDAGVARSRSEALAWCVRLVGRHQGEWIEQLRQAMSHVEQVRADGPSPD